MRKDNKPRTVIFKAAYWSYEEIDGQLIIHAAGLTEKNETVQLQINNFTPFVYLELPKRIKWDARKCRKIFRYFTDTMRDDAPLKYRLYEKDKLHYKKSTKVIFMSFPTSKACYMIARKCMNPRGGIHIPGVGSFRKGDFVVHEHNVDPILKLTAYQKIQLAGWIKVKETIPPDEAELGVEERKYSSADIDLYAKWTDVTNYHSAPEDVIIRPKYCSFDIECNSKNPNSKLPQPEIPENVVFQISLVFGRIGNPVRQKNLLSLFNPLDIDDITVIRCKTEKALLLRFVSLIQDEDPDVFIGYNIMKFDWNYLLCRAELLNCYPRFMRLSRILGKKAELKKSSWKSSAYGDQEFRYPLCHGRTNIDVLLEVERNHKLPKYSLNAVSEHFLRQKKDDITPRQLFMLYQVTDEILHQVENRKISHKEQRRIRKRIAEICPLRKTHGVVRELRERLLTCSKRELCSLVRTCLTLTGKYCVQDTILPIELEEKLNLWTTMEQMSNVMHVPPSYLHTRGQQIKVLAQIYRETVENNIIIPYQNKSVKSNEKYQGAIVIEAHPGYYDNVGVLDFASLYPSTMIAFNICYTTILEDSDPTPDSECHVLKWSDHVGCIALHTPISLQGRSERIQNLDQDVQQVYAASGEGVKLHNQIAHYEQGMKECVALTFKDGTVLKCTPDHRILTSDGEWIEAQDLKIGDTKVQMTYRPPIFDVPDDYRYKFGGKIYRGQDVVKLMHLFGLLCTDGTLTKGRTVAYVGHPLDVETVCSTMSDLFEQKCKPRKVNYGWKVPILGKTGEAFRTTPGINLKSKAMGRSIPDFLLSEKCPDGVVAAFLSGMFGGNGHTITFSPQARALSPISFSWSSNDPKDLDEIFEKLAYLLSRLGFHPTISRSRQETNLRIPTEETLLFHEKVGFAHCVHKAMRLEAGSLYLRHRDSVWKQQKRIVDRVRVQRNSLREKKKRFKIKDLVSSAIKEEKFAFNSYYGNPTASQMTDFLRPRRQWKKPMFSREYFPGPMEFMKMIGARSLFADGNGTQYAVDYSSTSLPTFSIPLIHKENCGVLPTYDLEVDKSHSFVANGIIVHNCIHDPQKRKKKKEEIMCGNHHYRFRKVKIQYDEKTGKMVRKHEGLMPRLERGLLTSRKEVKKEMFKAEARLEMQRGQATEKDLAYYRKVGYEIIEKGHLGPKEEEILEVVCKVLNAKQLAIKVSANSAYGALGAKNGYMPLIAGAASVTAMGRKLIIMAIDRIRKEWKKCKLVYGDTDSCMILFEGCDLKESFELCESASKLATHHLKCWIVGVDEDFTVKAKGKRYRLNKISSKHKHFKYLSYEDKIKIFEYESTPIDFEFENMYIKFLLLSKKRYVTWICNREGEITGKTDKGCVLARRDNSEYLRSTYRKLKDPILENIPEEEVLSILYDEVNALFTRQISDTALIIYTGIKNVVEYANKIERFDSGTQQKREYYVDENGDPFDDPFGPLDPRLVYPNRPQSLLALKLLRRGTEIPPNTRLEYLYLENPEATHQGHKAEDYTYYMENKNVEGLKPDRLHYIEKQLTKPITELLSVKFPHEIIVYEKLDDQFDRVITSPNLSDLKRSRLFRTKKYSKSAGDTEGVYTFTGKEAKATYVIESSKKHGRLEFNPNNPTEAEIIDVCKRWKARQILNRVYRTYGLTRRPTKSPTQVGNKLRLNTRIIFNCRFGGAEKGQYGKVIELREEEDGPKKKKYFYSILMDGIDETILKNVPRKVISTFYVKDSTIMKDILKARTYYRQIIDHLDDLFSPLIFEP